jgi:hypothetical protein
VQQGLQEDWLVMETLLAAAVRSRLASGGEFCQQEQGGSRLGVQHQGAGRKAPPEEVAAKLRWLE